MPEQPNELDQLRPSLPPPGTAALEDRRAEQQANVAAALSGAIDGAGVQLRPGVAGQVVELLRADVQTVSANGTQIFAGPGLRSLQEHVKDRLTSAEFGHFRVDGARPPAGRPDRRPTRPAARSRWARSCPRSSVSGRWWTRVADPRGRSTTADCQCGRRPPRQHGQPFGLGDAAPDEAFGPAPRRRETWSMPKPS